VDYIKHCKHWIDESRLKIHFNIFK
jgi:hypothetical protein